MFRFARIAALAALPAFGWCVGPQVPLDSDLVLLSQNGPGQQIELRWSGIPEFKADSAQVRFYISKDGEELTDAHGSDPVPLNTSPGVRSELVWGFTPAEPGIYRAAAAFTANVGGNQLANSEVLLIEVGAAGAVRVVEPKMRGARELLADAHWQSARGTNAPPGFEPVRHPSPSVETSSRPGRATNLGPFTVKGRAMYRNKVYSIGAGGKFVSEQWLPVRKAIVSVCDHQGGSNLNVRELAVGYTDSQGYYSIQVPTNFDGVGKGGMDVQVRIGARNQRIIVLDMSNNYYEYWAKTYNDWPGGTLDTGTVNVPINNSAPFNIYDTMLRGYDYVVNRGAPLPAKVYAKWALNNKALLNPQISHYKSTHATIFVCNSPADGDEWDDDVLLHEYGHHISEIYNFDKNPGGPHAMYGTTNGRLAWAEGWATYFGSAVRNSRYYVDSTTGSATVIDIEATNTHALNDWVEAATAGILWDIYDTQSDEWDSLSDGSNRIWGVVTKTFAASDEQTVRDFYDGWPALGYGDYWKVQNIFLHHNIDYDAQSVTFPTGGTLYRGTRYRFRWEGFTSNMVNVDLQRNGATIKRLASNINNDEFEDFTINLTDFPIANNLRIRVASAPDATEYAYSPVFSTSDQARPLTVNGPAQAGDVESAYDVDKWVFNVPKYQQYTITTEAGSLKDGYLYLFGPNSSVKKLEEDDDDGPGSMPKIVRKLQPGTYYLGLEGFNTTDLGSYAIRVTQP